MIEFNPQNERIKSKYFAYEKEANGRSPQTIENIRKAIIRYEEFTKHEDFKTFNQKKATDFKLHLLKTKNKHGEPLSASTIAHTLRPLQDFLKWLATQTGYKSQIRYNDIAYLNINENDKHKIQTNTLKEYPSEAQIRKVLATMPSNTPVAKRNKALIAFIFATGARDGAVIGLKIKHLNIAKKYVVQDPNEVATKFRKRIHTKFYPVGDDIHQIIIDYVSYAQEEMFFTDNDPLFPKEELVHDVENSFTPILSRQHWQSATAIRGIFKKAFEAAGVKYYPPHRFRDTLSAIGRKLCTTTEDEMAWARNMGHESPATTFMVYGGFSPDQQFEVIERMEKKLQNGNDHEGDVEKALQLISKTLIGRM
jgi:site-specific recombinase XerD